MARAVCTGNEGAGMTPLIKEFVKLTDAPEQQMWFDIGEVPDSKFDHEIDGEFMTHLPFKRMAICGIDAYKHKFILYLVASTDNAHVSVVGFVVSGVDKFIPTDIFTYVNTPEGINLIPRKNADRPLNIEDCRSVMATIAYILESLDAGYSAYQQITKPNSPTNKRRIYKGKPALIYEWRTVVVEPKQSTAKSISCSHSSPRLHDRRGHWRTLASGRKIWVRNCKVGDASKGTVFHDYKVSA